ncbi:MAG: hypothetical protein PHS02_01970 [Candidatus ainarchaeum sp.]|nr:hypothetical protein [Candidatus ainarchaeum sp.]
MGSGQVEKEQKKNNSRFTVVPIRLLYSFPEEWKKLNAVLSDLPQKKRDEILIALRPVFRGEHGGTTLENLTKEEAKDLTELLADNFPWLQCGEPGYVTKNIYAFSVRRAAESGHGKEAAQLRVPSYLQDRMDALRGRMSELTMMQKTPAKRGGKKLSEINSELEASQIEFKYLERQYVVFQQLSKVHCTSSFSDWFNSREEAEKRAFLLLLSSRALDCKTSVRLPRSGLELLELLRTKTADYLKRNSVDDVRHAYGELAQNAKSKLDAFMDANRWLPGFFGSAESMADFRTGLFYFFMEHSSISDIGSQSGAFFSLKSEMEDYARRIIKWKETNLKPGDAPMNPAQIREITASAFFGQVFYHLDAKAMLVIVRNETEFENKIGVSGVGFTQQTNQAANSDLRGNEERKALTRQTGIKIEQQVVDMDLLSRNVCLNIMEGVKTFSLKCGLVGIKPSDVSPHNLEKSSEVAFHYNGNKKQHPDSSLSIREVYMNNFMTLYGSRRFFSA